MTDHAAEVRYLLTDARQLCDALGLSAKAKPSAGGLQVLCPSHEESEPSCSVTKGPDGTLRAKCFACGWTADALGVIAHVRGLDVTSADDFREVLAIGAQIGGDLRLADEIRGGIKSSDLGPRKPIQPPPAEPGRDYPDISEVGQLWTASGSVVDDADVSDYLRGRAIDPDAVAHCHLARVLPGGGATLPLPAWASCKAGSWASSGHRLIVRAWDHTGKPRSVRSWQVDGLQGPKRLPPSGYKAAGLVQANGCAVKMLLGQAPAGRVIVCEGEPDWLTWSTRLAGDVAVFGIGSGSWTDDFARRIPKGSEVLVRTHRDAAGDKYAAHVLETLGERVATWRLDGSPGVDENDKAKLSQLPMDPRSDCIPMNALARKVAEEIPRILTVRQILQESHKRAVSEAPPKAMTTGHWKINRLTGGIRPGHTWVLGAGTSWGKSSLAIAIADENIQAGAKVLIVSSEDDESMYGDRLMARRAKVSAARLRDRCLQPEEHKRVCAVLSRAEDIPVYLDGRGVTFERLAHQIDGVMGEHRIDLVILDYIQECRTKQRHEDDRRMFREIARLFRLTVKARKKAGILLSQLTISDPSKPPTHNDVRECKDMSHGAEVVILGWKPAEDVMKGNECIYRAGSRVLIVDKAKDGMCGSAEMSWNDESASFDRSLQPYEGGEPGIPGWQRYMDDLDDAIDAFPARKPVYGQYEQRSLGQW